jgi:hypothetical protein
MVWGGRNAYRTLVGKPEGRRPRSSWEVNIKIVLKETDREDVVQHRDRWRRAILNRRGDFMTI